LTKKITESRFRSGDGTCELRAGDGGRGPVIAGYAAVFNTPSSDMGFVERIRPGAFDKTLTEADVRCLGNHDVDWLLGRSKSGTLRLRVDATGLYYECNINEADPDGVRALEKVRRGDWDGASFSFQCIRDEWNWDTTPPQRELVEVALIDVAPVTFPAYEASTTAARTILERAAERRTDPRVKLYEAELELLAPHWGAEPSRAA
jgi:hypothetical protein